MDKNSAEKYEAVVEEIYRLREGKILPFGPVRITPSKENALEKVSESELHGILFSLRHSEGIIHWQTLERQGIWNLRVALGNKSAPEKTNDGKTILTRQMREPLLSQTQHAFTILPKFDGWYVARKIQRDHDFKLLSDLNFHKVYITAIDLELRLQTNPANTVTIPLDLGHKSSLIQHTERTGLFRTEALEYMKARMVVKSYSIRSQESWGCMVMEVDLGLFYSFLNQVKTVFEKRFPPLSPTTAGKTSKDEEVGGEPINPPQPEDPTEIVYEIRYSRAREVLLNNLLIAKLEFNSENDNVFGFLIEIPNRAVTLKEISKKLGGVPPIKRLLKIVENLGFHGDFQKAFFSVSKESILFRNPLRRNDLDSLGKTWLRVKLK